MCISMSSSSPHQGKGKGQDLQLLRMAYMLPYVLLYMLASQATGCQCGLMPMVGIPDEWLHRAPTASSEETTAAT